MDVVHVRGVRTTGYSSKFGFALTFALVSIQLGGTYLEHGLASWSLIA